MNKKTDVIVGLVALLMTALFMAAPAIALTTSWDGGTGSWSATNPDYWDNGVPGTDDTAIIDNAGTAEVGTGVSAKAYSLYVGNVNSGSLDVDGGSIDVGVNFYLGYNSTTSSSVEVESGNVSAHNIYINNGSFTQRDGTVDVSSYLYLGLNAKGRCLYSASGGTFRSSAINVYNGGEFIVNGGAVDLCATSSAISVLAGGIFDIANSASNVTLTASNPAGGIVLQNGSEYLATTGAAIRMNGNKFVNNVDTANEADINGLANTEFIFQDGTAAAPWQIEFEVAGEIDGGFNQNFAIHRLTIGDTDSARVKLVDNRNNGNRGLTKECLYVNDAVSIANGSALNLNGINLYVSGDVESTLDGWIADKKIFDSFMYVLDAVYISNDGLTAIAPSRKNSFTSWIYSFSGQGDWNTAGFWDNGVPTSSLLVFINNNKAAKITAGFPVAKTLVVGDNNDGYLYVSGGTLSVLYHMYTGIFGKGKVFHTGGVVDVNLALYIGFYDRAFGSYDIDAGATLNVDADGDYGMCVGHEGEGVFNHGGGTVCIGGNIGLGHKEGKGTYNFEAGSLSVGTGGTVGSVYVGYDGDGTFNMTGGTLNIEKTLYIALNTGSEGFVNLDAGSLHAGGIYIGSAGELDIDLSAINYFRIDGNYESLLDGYIASGKIYDSTTAGTINAVYEPANGWTVLE